MPKLSLCLPGREQNNNDKEILTEGSGEYVPGVFTKSEDLQLEPGDRIEFERTLYEHWGLCSGKDPEANEPLVIHCVRVPYLGKLGSFLQGKCIIKEETLSAAAEGRKARVNNSRDTTHKVRTTMEIVKDAKKCLGEVWPFSIKGKNCEYYVNKWRYGKGFSDQVTCWTIFLVLVGFLIAFITGFILGLCLVK
ncbi:unnamed protein product [Owenia fusiformis]|uniref:LRAT domain-containing protein n=1 Tax=Owenia fusiformis TaxID=6347 RepID=A0A8S4NQK9_OWEFU|nr:unnamed protein product [Owenia fusiformis]